MARIILPETFDRGAAQALVEEFNTAMRDGSSIVVDASAVERIGQAGLQLLLSAQKSARLSEITLAIKDPSDVLTEAAALTGLSSHLFPIAALA